MPVPVPVVAPFPVPLPFVLVLGIAGFAVVVVVAPAAPAPPVGVAGRGRGVDTIEPIPAGVRIPPLSEEVSILREGNVPAAGVLPVPTCVPVAAPVAVEVFAPVVGATVAGLGVLTTVDPPPVAKEFAEPAPADAPPVLGYAGRKGKTNPDPVGRVAALVTLVPEDVPAVTPLPAVEATPVVDLVAVAFPPDAPLAELTTPAPFAAAGATVPGFAGNRLFGTATLPVVEPSAPVVPDPVALVLFDLGAAASLAAASLAAEGYFIAGPCPGINSDAAGAAPGV